VTLALRAITKSFGGVQALRGADLEASPGEIVALCGENGAGKSTLLKVLAGVHAHGSFGGTVTLDGKELRLRGTNDALAAGVAIVHQELMLPPNLTVADCLALGREPTRFGLVDDARLEADARAALARYGFASIDARAEVSTLGIGLQQVVEIVRALRHEARVLVLDEPTAALTAGETARLLEWLRELRTRGTTIVYVTHRLDEVFALCDRVVVLRDGKTALTARVAELTPDDVVRAMVGRAVAGARGPAPAPSGPPVLRVDDLRLVDARTRRAVVDGVSFTVAPGEIVGLAGAMGAGRTALLSVLFGVARGAVTGEVHLGGERVAFTAPSQAIARGVALVPEDRKRQGLVLGMTVAENLVLTARGAAVDPDAELVAAAVRIRELRIRGAAGSEVLALSGGNQQKVALGKWLGMKPRLLLLDEPTRGVDIGAREEIYGIVEELAANGAAVLFASSDLAELRRLAHRIAVMRQGRIATWLHAGVVTEEDIVTASTGAAA